MVKLDSPVELGACVGTVCLPEARIDAGSTCWITGWGTLRSRGGSPDLLQEAPVVVRANTDCGWYPSNQITERMLCAQGTKGDDGFIDACQGDSGGPLVCEVNGKWVLHGATSWGRGCAGENYPGIWAKITNQLSWIEDMMENPPEAPRQFCPDFATTVMPDRDGDCKCKSGKCSNNGRESYMCPTSGRPGGWGGAYFLPACTDCECQSTR